MKKNYHCRKKFKKRFKIKARPYFTKTYFDILFAGTYLGFSDQGWKPLILTEILQPLSTQKK